MPNRLKLDLNQQRWMGLIFSIISAIMFSLHSPSIGANWYTSTILGGIFLLIAGFFDALDGSIARVTNKTSALGGFLDSIIDKVSEIIIFVGILIGNYTNPVLVLVTLSMAILVSYTRARAESIGVDLKGKGIAERAERIIILAILAFIPFRDNISVALWIISIISIITILQRLKIVSEIFGTPLFSVQTLSQIFKREDTSNTNYSLSSNRSFSPPSNGQSSTSTSLKTSNNAKQIETRPQPAKEIKPETKTSSAPKADFLDKTDPNETGRNVAQLIFEQENEDKKMGKKSNTAAAQSSTNSSTASTANTKKQDNNTSNTSSTASTSSTAKPNATNSSKEEDNDSTKNQQ